jgi:hypothetical protein
MLNVNGDVIKVAQLTIKFFLKKMKAIDETLFF